MKRIELTKDRKALYLSVRGGLLAEVLGTQGQGLELVAKFNQHAELVKALRGLLYESGNAECTPLDSPRGRALALLAQIDEVAPIWSTN